MTPQRRNAAKVEELLKEGCRLLTLEKQNGGKLNIKRTANLLSIPYSTLHARFCNIHKSRREAHTEQLFLSPSLERVLVKWIVHLGSTGRPLCKWTIRVRAQHLHPDNKKPGRNWIYRFLQRHPDIVLSTPCGLDPKRAKAFNVPLLTAILMSLRTLPNHLVFHWRIYITWMRRDVREVVEREVAAENICTRGGSVQSTSIAAQTWNLSQLLKQSVQTEQHSSPDLCFQARRSVLNGLKSILILCMNLCCVS